MSRQVPQTIDASLSYARLNLGRLISLELSREPVTPVGLHRLELLRESREALEALEEMLDRRQLAGRPVIDRRTH